MPWYVRVARQQLRTQRWRETSRLHVWILRHFTFDRWKRGFFYSGRKTFCLQLRREQRATGTNHYWDGKWQLLTDSNLLLLFARNLLLPLILGSLWIDWILSVTRCSVTPRYWNPTFTPSPISLLVAGTFRWNSINSSWINNFPRAWFTLIIVQYNII